MFFKKYHIVKIQHIKYKNVYANFNFNDNKILLAFLKDNYKIPNFKVVLEIETSKINIADMIEIYNLNPYLEDLKLENLILDNSKDFLKKYDINNYEVPHEVYEDTADPEAAYYVYMLNDNKEPETYLFPDFETFYINLKKIKNANIEHSYLVEPSIISVSNYLKVLSLYGTFEKKDFKNSFEINQFIKDMRVISEVKVPEIKQVELS